MNFTSEQITQYVRIALYWAFGVLATLGVTMPESTKLLITSILGTGATLVWTYFGTRLQAKIDEVAKAAEVQKIVVANPATAAMSPSSKVVVGRP